MGSREQTIPFTIGVRKKLKPPEMLDIKLLFTDNSGNTGVNAKDALVTKGKRFNRC